jgi:3-phosphoshikimate 1-carboxyvinyltransferase
MAVNLRTFGITVTETEDGMDISGSEQLLGGAVDSYGDHRIAMSMSVAALVASSAITVSDIDCVATSFPTFFPLLAEVAVN